MKIQAIYVALLVAAQSWVIYAAEEPAEGDISEDSDDLDDEDSEEAADGGGPEEGPSTVEDFDLGMSEADQKTRMKACYSYTMRRAKVRGTELQESIKEMMSSQQFQSMTQEQVAESIVFSWMMTCYMNIDEANVKTAMPTHVLSMAHASADLTETVEKEVFTPKTEQPQQVESASRRQWQLLETVLTSETERVEKLQQSQKSQSTSQSRSEPTAPAQRFGATYAFLAFGVIFGIAILGVLRLNGTATKTKDRSSKGSKKAEKAERKMARKLI